MKVPQNNWPASNELQQVRTWLVHFFDEKFEEREAKSMSQLLLEHQTKRSKIELLLNGHQFSEIELVQLKSKVNRILLEEPLQYVLGEAHFFGLDLVVSEACLIPRPETEELVDWVLQESAPDLSILEIGSGSGCIPIALKSRLPEADITSIDISEEALGIAKVNAEKFNLHIDFVKASIFDFNPQKQWDIIVSNPPYIPNSDKTMMAAQVLDHEPNMALFVPNDDPLKFYKAIMDFCKDHLSSGGRLYAEIHEDYAAQTKELFLEVFKEVIIKKDLQGKDRMISAGFR